MFIETSIFTEKGTSHYIRIAYVSIKQFMGYLYKGMKYVSDKWQWEVL